jgi:hypothetical protein
MTTGVKNLFSPVTKPAEFFIKTQPLILSLIILYQGLFAPNAIKIPERLGKLFDNKAFRLASLMAIAFSATGDIEYALLSTVIFLVIMYLLKTPEERQRTGFI